MSRKRILTIAAGTAVCALSVGFMMQSSQASRVADAVDWTPPAVQSQMLPVRVPDPAIAVNGLPGLRDVELTAADLSGRAAPPALPRQVAYEPQPEIPALPGAGGATARPEPACEITALAETAVAATVSLFVEAPCLPNQRLTVHHSGMMFTETTDDRGEMSVLVPALAEQAVFVIDLSEGRGAVAHAAVPDVAAYDRVVLQWAGDAGFALHAREYGAEYGAAGHIWSGAGRGAEAAASGDGGFVLRLGADAGPEARQAEIYTFPTRAAERAGAVAISVEAEITAGNCGRSIEAQALERRPDAGLRTRDLALAMPDCAAQGDFLVLNDLVNDLKIAGK